MAGAVRHRTRGRGMGANPVGPGIGGYAPPMVESAAGSAVMPGTGMVLWSLIGAFKPAQPGSPFDRWCQRSRAPG